MLRCANIQRIMSPFIVVALFLIGATAHPALCQKAFGVKMVTRQRTVFHADGKPVSRRQNRSQEPKEVIDTVKIVGGFGEMKFRNSFAARSHFTAPTGKKALYAHITRVLSDSTETVYSYSYVYDDKQKRLVVKSSGGTADTGQVVVTCYVK